MLLILKRQYYTFRAYTLQGYREMKTEKINEMQIYTGHHSNSQYERFSLDAKTSLAWTQGKSKATLIYRLLNGK